MIEGGCFCGNIRYSMDDQNYQCADCHCTMCRRVHSAPYVTWLVVPAEKFRYTAGSPQSLQSSTDGTRYFCRDCGSHVACINTTHPDIVDVPVGSLDLPERFRPEGEVFADTKLAWLSGHGG